MKTPPSGSLVALVVLAVAMSAGGADAGNGDSVGRESGRGLLDERFTAQVGTFLLSTRTRIGVDGAAGQVGTRIDLERDLGLRTGDRFRADLNWRITGRHHVRASYFDYGMEASRSIARDLVIRDTVFPVSASVSAGFGTQILELGYEYALVRRNDWELLGTIGAHVLQFDFEASGQDRPAHQPQLDVLQALWRRRGLHLFPDRSGRQPATLHWLRELALLGSAALRDRNVPGKTGRRHQHRPLP